MLGAALPQSVFRVALSRVEMNGRRRPPLTPLPLPKSDSLTDRQIQTCQTCLNFIF